MSEGEIAELLGGRKVFGKGVVNRMAIARVIERGLPLLSLERMKKALALTDPEVASTLDISKKTIGRLRSKEKKQLGTGPSDRLYRIARVFAFAVEVFENSESARKWLRNPQIGLANEVPLDLLVTEAGSREVEDLLGRIEYGVFS